MPRAALGTLRAQESVGAVGAPAPVSTSPVATSAGSAVDQRATLLDQGGSSRLQILARQPPAPGGPTLSFICPAVHEPELGPEDTTKPLFLFLPGLDGLGATAEPQWPDLERHYEIRVLQISAEDRSSWGTLLSFVADFVEGWLARASGAGNAAAPPVLMGESMGGVVALSVALRGDLQDRLGGLVLVNPATSIESTALPQIADTLAAIPGAVPAGERPLSALLDALPDPLGLRGSPLAAALPNRTVGDLAYGAVGGGFIAATALDLNQAQRILALAAASGAELAARVARGDGAAAALEAAEVAAAGMDMLLALLPAGAVQHRVAEWIVPGARALSGRLGEVRVPVLAVCGDSDNLLPSSDEGERLRAAIPDCTLVRARNTGHAALDDRFNLTRAVLRSPLAPPRPPRDYVRDFVTPSPAQFDEAWQSTRRASALDPAPYHVPRAARLFDRVRLTGRGAGRGAELRELVSPAWYSCDPATGRVVAGLEGLPAQVSGKPLLFVGNHQVLALELALLVGQVYREQGVLMRGLAHPLLFSSQDFAAAPGASSVDSDRNFFETFGAVPVSPRNFARLMQGGSAVLLYPGGVKETVPSRDKEVLAWPAESEFVRLAHRYNATIVPFGGIGAADLVNVLADSDELAELRRGPLGAALDALGSVARPPVPEGARRAGNFSGTLDSSRLQFEAPPLFAPRAPWEWGRFYFLFGRPIEAGDMDVSEPAAVAREYARVRRAVEDNIAYLKRRRPQDPYGSFVPRLAYERLTGRPAPSFKP